MDPGTKLQVATGPFSVLGTYDSGTSKVKGAFNPLSVTYSMKNTGNERIQYEVSKNAAWLRITSDDPQVCVGGQNSARLKALLRQPANERPKTAHLMMWDGQKDGQSVRSKSPEPEMNHEARTWTHIGIDVGGSPLRPAGQGNHYDSRGRNRRQPVKTAIRIPATSRLT
jgi:hypothetical protein